jgi:hypothetical protein
LTAPGIFFLLALAMEPINRAAFASPETVSAATKPCCKGCLVRQHANLQYTLSICCTPIQPSARLQPCLADDLGRNSHLVLSCYSRYHGQIIALDYRIVKGKI